MKSTTAITRSLDSGQRIGIVGDGQLAKMMAIPALTFGNQIVILERNENTPASGLADETLHGDWDNPDELLKLADKVDVMTLENEFVDANALLQIEDAGHLLYPGAATIVRVQDKLIQKQTLAAAGIRVADFAAVDTKQDIENQAELKGWPLVLKARRNSYDGKGNATLNSASDVEQAWQKFDGDNRQLYVEAFCPFKTELAVMITRSTQGDMVSYPVVESIQHDHICHIVRAPATIDEDIAGRAESMARNAVMAIDGVGTIGVEMFLTKDDEIILNEMAPRVHNSGHYTIEACHCSQFENHIRAILGLPLGPTTMVSDAAVMVNLLGEATGSGYPAGLDQALSTEGAHIHIYGKTRTTPGRKMGHITALGRDIEAAEHIASKAAACIRFGAEQ